MGSDVTMLQYHDAAMSPLSTARSNIVTSLPIPHVCSCWTEDWGLDLGVGSVSVSKGTMLNYGDGMIHALKALVPKVLDLSEVVIVLHELWWDPGECIPGGQSSL